MVWWLSRRIPITFRSRLFLGYDLRPAFSDEPGSLRISVARSHPPTSPANNRAGRQRLSHCDWQYICTSYNIHSYDSTIEATQRNVIIILAWQTPLFTCQRVGSTPTFYWQLGKAPYERCISGSDSGPGPDSNDGIDTTT
jgi:hypothetical protein